MLRDALLLLFGILMGLLLAKVLVWGYLAAMKVAIRRAAADADRLGEILRRERGERDALLGARYMPAGKFRVELQDAEDCPICGLDEASPNPVEPPE